MKLTQGIVRELLDYDPSTGVFTWRQRGRHWFKSNRSCGVWNAKHSGKVAGSIRVDERGYRRVNIGIFNKRYGAHRIAFLWMEGRMPDEVDHENHDGTDNRWLNLREYDRTRNTKNKSMYSSNKSGVTGVSWDSRREKWQALVTMSGVTHHLGYFDREDIDIAAITVMEFRIENGFDPSHGMELAPYHREVLS